MRAIRPGHSDPFDFAQAGSVEESCCVAFMVSVRAPSNALRFARDDDALERVPGLFVSRSLHDLGEAARVEAGSADQRSVDVGLSH
jgi:hypothetical protein